MSATSGIILVLLNTIIVPAISMDVQNYTNKYFEQCTKSRENTSCHDTVVGPKMKRCQYDYSMQLYCVSPSRIHVAIGRHFSKSNSDVIFAENLDIVSTASSQNVQYSHCVKIAAKAHVDYYVQCSTNTTDEPKDEWIQLLKRNWVYNASITSPKYINVTETGPETFCKNLSSTLAENDPVLLPCRTWQTCAIKLASEYKNPRNAELVDLSTIRNETKANCPTIEMLLAKLQTGRTEKFSRPGLLAVHYQSGRLLLLPYNPLSGKGNLKAYEDTLLRFQLQSRQGPDKLFIIECQSSVLHSCGLEIATSDVRIESSSSDDCHRHLMTVEPISGLNGTITCNAFNEFRGEWDSETKYFPSNDVKISTEKTPTESPNRTGNNSTKKSGEIKTTETPIHGGGTIDPKFESTTATPLVDDGKDTGSNSLVLIIVGTLLGGIFLCFLILLPLLVYLYKRIHLQKRRIRLTEEELWEFMDGMKTEKAESRGIHDVFVLPYDRSLEISKTAVDFKTTVLGSGAFGQVVKGVHKGHDVAIKTIDSSKMNAESFRSLLSELKIMSYLGKHEHVMELVGAITSKIKKGEVYLILEYCTHGSAVNYISGRRDAFVSLLSDDNTSYIQTSRDDLNSKLSSQHLVRWSYEVACGMEYVSSLKIYHGDLAARNILLTEDLSVKIGDFGLSRQLDMENYTCYVQKGDCPLPLKWMAIESLRDLKFSIQSDVWSFGVTLWEFFSLGKIPYPGKKWNWESWKFLCEGVRLERPEFAAMTIYDNIMRKCWIEDPKDRPTFADLKCLLQDEMEAFS